MKLNKKDKLEIWGGIECTINRVQDNYLDQLEYSGHYNRISDLDHLGSLGITKLRYPIIWEKHQPEPDTDMDWSRTERYLNRLRELDITPIAGLVHHGSGPKYVNFYDGSFEEGLAAYAVRVAKQFPWLEYYTPVNEPLTTARFCGLYGHWYPHKASDYDFFKVLLSECKATVMAMKAIKQVNPKAKLIQTDDLGKCHSTPLLQYQADFENERRWVSYELLSGKLTPDKMMWKYMVKVGIKEEELRYFLENNYAPDICGFNYYLTSERYLDEDLQKYPVQYHGGNGKHQYADVHTALVKMDEESGAYHLIKEAWERLQLPMAITECHLYSPREDQMRWFYDMWLTLNRLRDEGVDIRALTAWALFGLHGWNRLCTEPWGEYEPGVFSLSSGEPRPTAIARLIQELSSQGAFEHPILAGEGWWKRDHNKIPVGKRVRSLSKPTKEAQCCRPLVIIGKNGTLGNAVRQIAEERNIQHVVLSRSELDFADSAKVEQMINKLNPWAIINAAGYANIDTAESEVKDCLKSNFKGPVILADICARKHIRFLTFSSDQVFDGRKSTPYVESDRPAPLSSYGKSKVKAEKKIQELNPDALIIRTSSFFGPWDEQNFVFQVLKALSEQRSIKAANDVYVSATYLPDLIHESLNMLMDHESGIFHLTNTGIITWAGLAEKVAEIAELDRSRIEAVPLKEMGLSAYRPKYSALISEKGVRMPSLDDALQRCFARMENPYVYQRRAG
jgi:dTDP-4-dehydrorhamnose reductase